MQSHILSTHLRQAPSILSRSLRVSDASSDVFDVGAENTQDSISIGLVDRAEVRRVAALESIAVDKQEMLGQYFTPYQAAVTVAGLPQLPSGTSVQVLDPGAGSGMLSAALVERLIANRPDLIIHLVAVEVDEAQHAALQETLYDIESLGKGNISTELVSSDFISWALATSQRFDLIIQNPPYAKLPAGGEVRQLLSSVGINVPNIYAAFLALGMRLLEDGGQQVAITPRSWMNGTYYAAFRHEIVRLAGIDAIHTFESRSKVFGDTGVLQEAIVVSATKGRHSDEVSIYTSHDHRTATSSRTVPYADVVTNDFIYVPTTEVDAAAVSWIQKNACHTLKDLNLSVSTGRVIDFRSRNLLLMDQTKGSQPMINSSHIKGGEVIHPGKTKKAQWFRADTAHSSKLLVPAGSYVLIKRFSAKEERRRVVAGVWKSASPAAFDNKLNFIHQDGEGIDQDVAVGLAAFLNSSQVDKYFRVFSGHTQVNATDLRQMRFPSLLQLKKLAELSPGSQEALDTAVEEVLTQKEVIT